MIKPNLKCPLSSEILEQAVAKIITALEFEETALSDILRFERGILQKAQIDSANLEEYVTINESVNGIMANVIEAEKTVRLKLLLIEGLFQTFETLISDDAPKEEI